MKKHNTVKVVLIVILCFLLLSWILPAAYFSSTYQEQGRVQMGLFDLANYPFTSLSYFGYIALFLILVGGFYGVLNKIPAYHNYLERFAKAFKGKEYLFLTIVSILLAFGVSICGLQIAFAIFIPFIVSIIFLMGYDKIVAALVVVGSMVVGLAGSTYATTNLSVLTQSLSLNTNYQVGVRFIILLVGIVLVMFNTYMYIKKNKNSFISEVSTSNASKDDEVVANTKKADNNEKENDSKEKTTSAKKGSSTKTSTSKKTTAKKSTTTKNSSKKSSAKKNPNKAAATYDNTIKLDTSKNAKIWPFNLFLIIMLVITILAFIPWSNAFGINAMSKAKTSITNFKIFGFALFSKLLGNFNEFGSWTIVDLLVPLFLSMFIIAFIYKLKFDDIMDGFFEGAKKALLPAVIVILLYTVLVLVTYHPFQLVIYKALIGKKFNIVSTTIVALLASLFNFEPAYVFQSVLPFYVSVVTNTANYPIVGVIFQSIYGMAMLVAPTSLILMVTLSYLGINYKEWLKNVWKIFLEFLAVLLIIFIILASI